MVDRLKQLSWQTSLVAAMVMTLVACTQLVPAPIVSLANVTPALSKPILSNAMKTPVLPVANKNQPRTVDGVQWQWPVPMPASYQNAGSSGIDIAGSLGETFRAAASGTVMYVGPGVQGYGDMIMIQQNDDYLTVYANVGKALVNQGDTVTLGQKIALLGKSPDNKTQLHFEIRKEGAPVDPLTLLPRMP